VFLPLSFFLPCLTLPPLQNGYDTSAINKFTTVVSKPAKSFTLTTVS
jgi:hypothetical protein